MNNKTEQFISKARSKHGDKYLYDLVEYRHCQENVQITCRSHGVFEQRPNSHLNGGGCEKCYRERQSATRRLTTSEFITRAKVKHGDKYDYSLSEYTTNGSSVKIICPLHGMFETLASGHMAGKGCVKCGVAKCAASITGNTESFIEKARKTHSGLYTYELVEYSKSNKKVIITCPKHGVFEQTPANHVFGKGCPHCMESGYQVLKPGSFYILQSGDITKVGITNRDVKIRLREINRSSGKDFIVVSCLTFGNGLTPLNIETACLKWLSNSSARVAETFDGSTECFLNVDLDALINFITPLASPESV